MVPIVLVLELVLVLDFVQRQEHFWPASCVSESSSLCLSQRATHGKGWSLRLRLSAFGLRPTPTRPSADPPTHFSNSSSISPNSKSTFGPQAVEAKAPAF